MVCCGYWMLGQTFWNNFRSCRCKENGINLTLMWNSKIILRLSKSTGSWNAPINCVYKLEMDWCASVFFWVECTSVLYNLGTSQELWSFLGLHKPNLSMYQAVTYRSEQICALFFGWWFTQCIKKILTSNCLFKFISLFDIHLNTTAPFNLLNGLKKSY